MTRLPTLIVFLAACTSSKEAVDTAQEEFEQVEELKPFLILNLASMKYLLNKR